MENELKKVKIAIVGVGSISNCHIGAYQKNSRAEIVAFCDINEEVLKRQGEKYAIKNLFTSIDDMLSSGLEIDAVSICTWNNTHAPLSIKALRAGKDVLCEKPMAINYDEAVKMHEEAVKNNRKLQIGFVRRYGNDCDIAKELIEKGRLGDIYYAKACYIRRNGNPGGWFGNKALSGGGPLIDLGVHVIDLVRYLSGNPKAVNVKAETFYKLGNRSNLKAKKDYSSVTTAGKKDICDVEDMAVALIKFDNGAVLSLETSFSLNVKKDESYIELFGTKSGLKIDNDLVLSTDIDDYMTETKISGNNGFDFYGAFDNEINHFINVVANDCKSIAPPEDGVELMKIIDAIYKSAREGREIIL